MLSLFRRPPRFDGEVALVTGAASGIGRALALELARRGAEVLVTDRDGPGAETVAAEIRAARASPASDRAAARPLDVTDAAAVRAAVDGLVAARGRIDAIVNNAGIAILAEAKDHTLEHWRRTFEVNLFGVVNGVHAALPHMLKAGRGRIVNVASASGLGPSPGFWAYGASKHAVVGLSRTLDAEVARHGIGVTVVCPTFIDTPIIRNADSSLGITPDAILAAYGIPLMPADACARATLDAVGRGRLVAIMPLAAKLVRWTDRLAPWIVRAAVRRIAAKLARRP